MKRRIVKRKVSSSSTQSELNLEELSGRNPNCQKCGLWESAETPCTWGKGPAEAKVMVVVEAPGGLEDRVDKPLQGKSGELFRSFLTKVGINPKTLYITHAAKCKPPEGSSPSAADMKACRPYLDAEIAAVKPEYVITLGAGALKAMNRKVKITETHGSAVEGPGYTLIPTYHPGMALRDPTKMEPLIKDIQKVANIINGNAPKEEDIHWEIIRTLDAFNEFMEEFSESKEVAIDIETTGLDRMMEGGAINSIQIGLNTGRNFAIPLAARDSPWKDKPKTQRLVMESLIEAAEDKIVIGHNFKFDNGWVKEKFGNAFHLRFDTMLAHHILDENTPHGLKELTVQYCNAPNYDVDLKTKLGQGDMKKFYKYGCFDVYYTMQLYWIFRAMLLKDPSLRRLFYKLVMPVARMFQEIEEDGLYINMEKLAQTEKSLTRQKEKIKLSMDEQAGEEVNWNSPAQIGKLFYEKLKLPILEKTPKGAPSTSESVLLRLRDHSDLAKQLIEYRGIDKNLGTYILGWQELMHGDRLYLSTKIHGTVTGRFASRLHQVPRNPMIRSLIDAPEDEEDDWVFVCADYSQIELRLAAMLSNDAVMKMIFQTGGDIHRETAAFVLGKRPEDLTKEERKMAKAINFGLVYGMGAPKLVIYARDNYEVDMSDREAKSFRTRFFERYNGLLPWHERQRRCVRVFKQVVSLSGRIRRLPGIDSTDRGIAAEAERQGINSPVQGFGSGDLKAMAMVEIHETIPQDDARIKGEVHDSILLWVRKSKLNTVLPQIKAIMEAPKLLDTFGIRMTVPLVADFEVGPWGMGTEWKFTI